MNARDPKFTTRLGRALWHLANGRSLEAAARLGVVTRTDLQAWLDEFNGGGIELTSARIEQVRQEVGVVAVMRRADAPEAAPAVTMAPQRMPASLGGEPIVSRVAPAVTAPAGMAEGAPSAPGAGQEAIRKWTERKRALKVAAAPAPAAEVTAVSAMPWREIQAARQRKAAHHWRAVLEFIIANPKAKAPAILAVVRRNRGATQSAWTQFRQSYFGGVDGCTAAAAREFLSEVAGWVEPAGVVAGASESSPVDVLARPPADAAPAFVISGLEAQIDGNPFTILTAIAADGAVIGTVTLRWRRREIADLHRLFVATEWRRQGVARSLIGRCIEIAMEQALPALSLSVNPGNDVARLLYLAMGFRPCFQFEDGDLLMSLELPLRSPREGRAA